MTDLLLVDRLRGKEGKEGLLRDEKMNKEIDIGFQNFKWWTLQKADRGKR